MSKFTEAQLEQSIIDLLGEQGYPHVIGSEINLFSTAKDFLAVWYAKNA